jgi:hypothetical protein
MIHALIFAAAVHASSPPPSRSPPSAREVVELQLKSSPVDRPPSLSAAEARRLYELYLSGLGAPPLGGRTSSEASSRDASAGR